MAVSLIFADSFAHYNNTALKWSSGGGVFETDLAHVRTGPQSLRIQAGDSPSILNFLFPVDSGAVTIAGYARFTLGFAWQTQSLAGETIVELWDTAGVAPAPAERQFYLIQNANGSISVRTGNGAGTLIGTTAAGILTIGPWWYIELTVDLVAATLELTITDAGGVAVSVLSASAFTTTQIFVDSLFWGGPSGANSAWIADFYFGAWDTFAPGVLGAPKIYGLSVPNADGQGALGPGAPPPFNVSAAPWWSQVNTLPQQTAVFISRDLEVGDFWTNPIAQAFQHDVSSVPVGATVAALQVTMLISMDHDGSAGVPQAGTYQGNTGDAGSFNQQGTKSGLVDSPFLFYPFPFDQDPINVAPWTVAEFSGPTAFQIGPTFFAPG